MSTVFYMLREARQGIRRNIGAALATVLITFIALSMAGSALMLKSGVDDAVGYLRNQVKIKLFVDPATDIDALSAELEGSGRFTSVLVETGPQMLVQLRSFFVGREYLFEAFQQGEIPATITLDIRRGEDMDIIAAELGRRPGVFDVIYPQEFARSVLSWSNIADRYSVAAITILLLTAFLTICIAINLAMHQRHRDIRIKLLLGAKESHVRAQFLFEGALLGLVGGLLATVAVYYLNELALKLLALRFPLIFSFGAEQLFPTLALVVGLGMAMGFVGAYFTTRRLIENG